MCLLIRGHLYSYKTNNEGHVDFINPDLTNGAQVIPKQHLAISLVGRKMLSLCGISALQP